MFRPLRVFRPDVVGTKHPTGDETPDSVGCGVGFGPGHAAFDVRLTGKSEDVFGDDVALHGERAATERQCGMEEVAVVPDRVDVGEQ